MRDRFNRRLVFLALCAALLAAGSSRGGGGFASASAVQIVGADDASARFPKDGEQIRYRRAPAELIVARTSADGALALGQSPAIALTTDARNNLFNWLPKLNWSL